MAVDRIKLGGPGVLFGQPGQVHLQGILHFNTGKQLDWRTVGSDVWKLYNGNMISTSNYIRYQDPNYSNYFTSSTVAIVPAGAAANTCVMLVSGSQYGSVYTIGNNNSGRIFNPNTNTYTTITQQVGINIGVTQTCALLYDGRVVNIPAPTTNGNSTIFSFYDPNINRIQGLNTINTCRNTSQAPDYWASIVLPSPVGTVPGSVPGLVFLPPYAGELGEPDTGPGTGRGLYPAIYNITTDTLTLIKTVPYDSTNTGATTTLYRDCCLLPSGRIFMIPHGATKAAIYDPVTQQTTFVSAPGAGSGRYYHGVTLTDGRVFCGRYNADSQSSIIYDETSNSFTTTIPLQGRLRKPILLPDNRICCIPFARRIADPAADLRMALYDPITNTATYIDVTGVTSTGGTPANTSDFYRAAAMLFDGKIFAPVGSANNALKFGSITYSFDWNVLASPYHNGR